MPPTAPSRMWFDLTDAKRLPVIASLVREFSRLLYPLANLCPSGKEDGPINVKKVIREQRDLVN